DGARDSDRDDRAGASQDRTDGTRAVQAARRRHCTGMKHLALALACAACQSDVNTPFPPGLEPLEDNAVPEQQGGAYTEVLRTSADDTDYIHIYARGYVLVAPGVLWAAAKNPDANVAVCSTDQQIVTPNDQPEYEYSFVVHYIVNNVVTVEWDDQWRFGTI